MSRLAEGIKLIQEDMVERFGVFVKVDLYVHSTGKNAGKMTRIFADWMTTQMVAEFGGEKREWCRNDSAGITVCLPVQAHGEIDFTAFYPAEQYSKEEEVEYDESPEVLPAV